ncbi:MAG: LacI family DNA-binding transcriptional regulator, partial [Planctomycetota bacterium]
MSDNHFTTLKSIAQELNLSESTVSRVINGLAAQYRISSKTEKAVLELVDKLQFSPNLLARSLRLSKTHTIGLIIPDISNPFFSTITRFIENNANQHDYTVMVCDTDENTSKEKESLDILLSRQVDGLIVMPVGKQSKHFERIKEMRLPIVLVDRYFPEVGLPYVSSNNFQGVYDAVSYMIQNGHKSIACVQGLLDTMANSERVRGYRQALVDHNLKVDETLIAGENFGAENGYVHTKLLLSREPQVTAVIALSNLIAMGSIRAIREKGLRIPDDISIIGFDDQPYCAYLEPPLTTVGQNEDEMGRIAIDLLLKQIEGDNHNPPEGLLVPTQF